MGGVPAPLKSIDLMKERKRPPKHEDDQNLRNGKIKVVSDEDEEQEYEFESHLTQGSLLPTFQNSCIILQSCSSFFFCLHGQPKLFASDHLLQSFRFLFVVTLLQSFEIGQGCFSWFSIFSFSRPILSLSFHCSSVPEALFALNLLILRECFFFVHAKATLAYSRNE